MWPSRKIVYNSIALLGYYKTDIVYDFRSNNCVDTPQSVGAWMSLPRASYVKAIDIWISTCVFFVFAAMLEFAMVNTLARKEIRRISLKIRGDVDNRDINVDIVSTPSSSNDGQNSQSNR